MKRAFLILVATIVAMLVCPATTPSAKSPSINDSPTIQIITPLTPQGEIQGNGEGDDGDADDVGLRGGMKEDGGPGSVIGNPTTRRVKVWWMYFRFLNRML